MDCYKSPHLSLHHLCINSFMPSSLQQTFLSSALLLCGRTQPAGHRQREGAGESSGLCSRSLQKPYLKEQAGRCGLLSQRRLLGSEAQGPRESSCLFLGALYLFSQNSKSMVSFHTGIKGMQKLSLPFHSFPPIPLLSVHWLPGSLCLSVLCYLKTVHNTEQQIKSSSQSHTKG